MRPGEVNGARLVSFDDKGGIRAVFFATEGLFRLMYPDAPQLNAARVGISSVRSTRACRKKAAIHVAQKQVAALKEWIDGAHFYRHEPGSAEPAPLELAVHVIAQGATHLRWRATVDRSAGGTGIDKDG